jgi:hypothetical protein
MATYIPPLEILPIFDSLVYSEANGYLTPSVANKRYLRFPTAQGNQTFPFGLTTDQISAITTGGTIYFYDNLTGIIYIARNGTNTYIGNSTSLTTIQSINAHNTSTSSDLYASSTGTLNIGNLTSIINVGINNAGNINLGSTTSTINITGSLKNSFISNPYPTLPVNLWTDTTTGLISIGNAGNTGQMVLYGSKVNIYNTTTQSIQPINTGNDVNLFTTSVSPTSINIGAVGTTINLNGSVVVSSISSQNIVSPAPSLPSSIYGTTTSSIVIGSSSAVINIPGQSSLVNPRYNGGPISFVENSSLIAPTSWITDNFGHKYLVNTWTQPQYMDGGMVSNGFYTNTGTAIGNIFSNTTGAINIGYTSSAIGIGQAQSASDTIIIGNTGSIVNIFGSTYFQNVNIDDIVAVSTAGPLSLWNNLTGQSNLVNNSNDIQIGNNQVASSTITIGKLSNTTTTMNGITNIINPRNTGATLLVGNNSTTMPPTSWINTYFGKLSVANTWALAQSFTTSVLTQTINCITAGTTVNMFDSSTGTVNISNNSNDIDIGTSQPVSSAITIGTATNSTVSVNGTLRTQSIFAPTASLATTSGVYSTNTGIINIGSATATPTVRGDLKLNNSITVGYTTLPSLISTQVGYINTINTASRALASSPAGTFNTLASYAVPEGVWSITVSVRIPSQVTNNNFSLSLSTSATVLDSYRASIVHTDGSSFIYRDNMTHVVVGGQTWYYIISYTLTASITYQFIGMVSTRIA